jgi:hypothetical protein
MSNRTWPSRAQQHFINDHIQKFHDAKTSGTLAAFYEEFYGNWFTRFPELKVVFPDANGMDELSKEDKEELEWHIDKKKEVCIKNKIKIVCLYIIQRLRRVLAWSAWTFVEGS